MEKRKERYNGEEEGWGERSVLGSHISALSTTTTKKGMGTFGYDHAFFLTESIQAVDILVLAGGQEAVDGMEDDGVQHLEGMLGKIKGAQVLELDILNERVLVFQKAWTVTRAKEREVRRNLWRRHTAAKKKKKKARVADIHPVKCYLTATVSQPRRTQRR